MRSAALTQAQRDLKREDFSTLAPGNSCLVASRAVLDLTTPGQRYQHTGTTQDSFETEFLSHTEHFRPSVEQAVLKGESLLRAVAPANQESTRSQQKPAHSVAVFCLRTSAAHHTKLSRVLTL